MAETGFVKAQSDNLPKIDVFMMSTYFASNSDFTAAELRGVKAASESNVDAILFALALEVALHQLAIVEGNKYFSSQLMPNKTRNMEHEKFVKDIFLLKTALRETILELSQFGEWSYLIMATDNLDRRASGITAMKLENRKLIMTRKQLKAEVRQKQNQRKLELYNGDYRIAYLRDKLKDDSMNSKARLQFAENWLRARAESMAVRCQTPISEKKTRNDLSKEDRVHQELRKALELQINEHEKSVEKWQRKYVKDTVDITQRVSAKRKQYEKITEKRKNLQNQYDAHNKEINDWITMKREKAERLEKEEKQREAATRVQAWWRGEMVRKCLGPFRNLKAAKKPAPKKKK